MNLSLTFTASDQIHTTLSITHHSGLTTVGPQFQVFLSSLKSQTYSLGSALTFTGAAAAPRKTGSPAAPAASKLLFSVSLSLMCKFVSQRWWGVMPLYYNADSPLLWLSAAMREAEMAMEPSHLSLNTGAYLTLTWTQLCLFAVCTAPCTLFNVVWFCQALIPLLQILSPL
jgi:hypothetical protein